MDEQISPSPGVSFRQIIEGLSLRPKLGFFGYSSVVLIKDGKENILFDTGGYGVRVALQTLLKDIVVHKVFLSHLHFDHCANISLFANAEIYVHQKELDALHSGSKSSYSDINDFIGAALGKSRVVPFSSEQLVGKNTKIVFTHGHTEGHSSLEILSQGKKTIIAGDAIETYQEYLDDGYRTECSDKDSYSLSKKRIRDNFSVIVPGHSSIIEDGILKDPALSLRYF